MYIYRYIYVYRQAYPSGPSQTLSAPVDSPFPAQEPESHETVSFWGSVMKGGIHGRVQSLTTTWEVYRLPRTFPKTPITIISSKILVSRSELDVIHAFWISNGAWGPSIGPLGSPMQFLKPCGLTRDWPFAYTHINLDKIKLKFFKLKKEQYLNELLVLDTLFIHFELLHIEHIHTFVFWFVLWPGWERLGDQGRLPGGVYIYFLFGCYKVYHVK